MSLNKLKVAGVALILAGFVSDTKIAEAAPSQPITVVKNFELNQYLGKWYEIGSIPQSFQEGCTCTSADYSLRNDGSVKVENRCIKNGKVDEAVGRATIPDAKEPAKLKVSFFLDFLPFFRADYWVIGLDQDYRYAVVSNKKGDTLWILSRTRQLEPSLLMEAMDIAKSQVDTTNFKFSVNTGCDLNP